VPIVGDRGAAIILLLILFFVVVSISELRIVKAELRTIIVPDDFASIQEAIDNADEGDMVFVKSGTYYNQTLIINKSLSLIGEDSQTTILKGLGVASSVDNVVWNKIRTNYTLLGTETSLLNFMGPTTITSVVEVSANGIKISGFTIEHYELGIYGSGNRTQIVSNILTASWDHASISMDGSYIEITNNSVYGGRSNTGILVGGSYNTITDNKIVGASIGIHMWGNFSIISGNNIIDSDSFGIYASGNLLTLTKNNIMNGNMGLALTYFSGSIISENNITKQTARAIWVDNSANNNVIWGNYIAPNQGYAIYFTVLNGIKGPINNTFHHNTIMSNAHNIQFTGYNKWNFWDNGVEGNYWSNYNGTDNNGDGIGDTPYVIDENNQDNYPLVNEIPEFPSWAPMLFMLIVLAVAVAIYKRRLRARHGS
jgi:nitrous oxidase accessory protein